MTRSCLVCAGAVRTWRECGGGCQLVAAYCPSCGGDARAVRQMVEHMDEAHGGGVLTISARSGSAIDEARASVVKN